MKILFLTMTFIPDLDCRYIYTELLKVFVKNGHEVIVVTPNPSKEFGPWHFKNYGDIKILNVHVLDDNEGNLVRKALKLLTIQGKYRRAIFRVLSNEHFDLILYSTPPITLNKLIGQLKRKHNASTYLMLKDIFPQNAVDLGLLSTKWPKKAVYNYFRKREKNLYKISDFIGCMSKGNVNYLLTHNRYLTPQKIGLCVNGITPAEKQVYNKCELREEFELPKSGLLLFFGGNLGKPQGIDFILKVLRESLSRTDLFFVICGSGTEYWRLKSFVGDSDCHNVKLIEALPKRTFDRLLNACDIGLLFLDYRFTIPNFPSRMLSYMEYQLPILAATDRYTDIQCLIKDGDLGWWCESRNPNDFVSILDQLCDNQEEIKRKGLNARKFLETNFTADMAYGQIMKGLQAFKH